MAINKTLNGQSFGKLKLLENVQFLKKMLLLFPAINS